jgi:uncharacterized protein
MQESDLWAREPDLDRLRAAHGLLKADPGHALRELEALAHRGSPMSMVYLGDAFRRGVGTPINIEQSENWFRRAYEAGSVEGLFQLGSLLLNLKRGDDAEKIFSEGVAKNFAPAMDRLATLYLKTGNAEKLAQAKTLLERATELGNVFAKRHLAGLLLSGRYGVRGMLRGARLFWAALRDGWSLSKTDPRSEYLR